MKITKAVVEANTPNELRPFVHESVTDPQALEILLNLFKNDSISGDYLRKFKVVNVYEFVDICITYFEPLDLIEMMRDFVECSYTHEEIIAHLLDNTAIHHWVLDHNGKESIDRSLEVMFCDDGWCE